MNVKAVNKLARISVGDGPLPHKEFPPSMYYRFLRRLTKYMQPDISVELGVCGGGGSLYMALGYPQGRVIGVDCALEYPNNIALVKELAPNFEFWRMDSIASSDYFNEVKLKVNVLFIDTIHTYDQTMKEFEAYRPVLADGAVVLLDDLFREGMDQAWAELPGHKVRLDYLHMSGSATDGGFGVVLI